MSVVRKAAEIAESTSIEMLLIVSFSVERIARIEFKDTRDIFAKKCYNDKVLVVEELHWQYTISLYKFLRCLV